MGKKLVHVMNTAFRDGFQSVFGARVFTKDFLPALEAAVHAGFTHFEAGGGARYQSLYFYCQEDAFDMMDAFRETVGPDANLQTLARGVNVVGLDSQSSDIIDLHAKMFKKHGMTTIRNFDALNDVRNLNYSGECITNAGLNHEVVIALMGLPPGLSGAHDAEFYVQCVRNILDDGLPFASICFKDASGTCPPSVVYESIKQTRKLVGDDVHLRVHTHETAGASIQQYVAALEAGVDGIDLSMAPVSGGTAQPDVITMWHVLRGTNFDLGFDIEKVMECEEVFKDCMKDYFMPIEAKATEPVIPFSPMPGGALTANTQMLRDNNMMDKFPKVIAAMREVVRRGGFGSSVTPVSQFYFQQAFNNVVFGEWKRIADSYGRMVLGYFGKTPVEPDPEIVKLASEQLGMEPTTRNPREINDEDPNKGIAAATKVLEAEGLPVTDENIFIAAACKDKGIAFLKGEGTSGVRKHMKETPAPIAAPGPVTVRVNGREYTVELNGATAMVNGQSYDFAVSSANGTAANGSAPSGQSIMADLSGKVVRLVAQPGASVAEGDTLLVLEALKMEMEVKAPMAGRIQTIDVTAGQAVNAGDVLATIGV